MYDYDFNNYYYFTESTPDGYRYFRTHLPTNETIEMPLESYCAERREHEIEYFADTPELWDLFGGL